MHNKVDRFVAKCCLSVLRCERHHELRPLSGSALQLWVDDLVFIFGPLPHRPGLVLLVLLLWPGKESSAEDKLPAKRTKRPSQVQEFEHAKAGREVTGHTVEYVGRRRRRKSDTGEAESFALDELFVVVDHQVDNFAEAQSAESEIKALAQCEKRK